MHNYIYHFDEVKHLNKKNLKSIIGNKAFNLIQMMHYGINVPNGFVISSQICTKINIFTDKEHNDFQEEIIKSIKYLQNITKKIFANQNKETTKIPLLLSIRSGAAVSMPGMMDTILNIGINDKIVEILKSQKGEKFAYDTYCRFIESYGNIILNIDKNLFHQAKIENQKQNYGFYELAKKYKQIIRDKTKSEIEQDPFKQLFTSIKAVFASSNSKRSRIYKAQHNIKENIHTAVTIQEMIFGNLNKNSATGVVFTRCPSSGEKKLFGEFLQSAQGEDIVSGGITPYAICKSQDIKTAKYSMESTMPQIYEILHQYAYKIEDYYKNMQDIEFTIEDGKLYILQTRNGKRSAAASLKITYDQYTEGMITKQQAINQIDPETIKSILHKNINYEQIDELDSVIFAKGLAAAPGCVSGIIVLNHESIKKIPNKEDIILITEETSPEDIEIMSKSQGIITIKGGMTSHAAVVARGMGKCCITSANIEINKQESSITSLDNNLQLKEFDKITIDGNQGYIFKNEQNLNKANISKYFDNIIDIANDLSNIELRVNAENVEDINQAIKFGARAIGLCRTEHMFFEKEKLSLLRRLIINDNKQEEEKIITLLQKKHTEDFIKILSILQEKTINIRLLDPPLHEFLPQDQQEITNLAKELNISSDDIRSKLNQLSETNPMLGLRGARLAICKPNIYQMQIQAISDAVKYIYQKYNIKTNIEIMIPFIGSVKEIKIIKQYINDILNHNHQINNMSNISIGTMIELPKAAIEAEKIATEVDFFSFGTNDLTQTTLGISRDDSAKFIQKYLEENIITADPFVEIDEDSVGYLIKHAIITAKKANPQIKFGICGEHAANKKSIEFFKKINIDYLSVSPFNIFKSKISLAQN